MLCFYRSCVVNLTNMKSWLRSFNIYLWAAGMMLACGCGSNSLSMNKDYTLLKVFLEGGKDDGALVKVGRDKIPIYVEANPILTEDDLSVAKIEDDPDGTYGIELTFNDHGSLVLDMNTAANRGRKHLVFFCQLRPRRSSTEPQDADASSKEKGNPGQPGFSPWLSAMPIRAALTKGSVRFTPDVSYQEAQQIVRGLNNMVSEINKPGH